MLNEKRLHFCIIVEIKLITINMPIDYVDRTLSCIKHTESIILFAINIIIAIIDFTLLVIYELSTYNLLFNILSTLVALLLYMSYARNIYLLKTTNIVSRIFPDPPHKFCEKCQKHAHSQSHHC